MFSVEKTIFLILLQLNISIVSQASHKVCTTCFKPHFANQTVGDFLDKLFENYNRYNRPHEFFNLTTKTTVNISVRINSFGYINTRDMEYELDIILKQTWEDKRLEFTSNKTEYIVLNDNRDRLWLSDLHFRNAKQTISHTVTKPNYLLWLYQNGTLLYKKKLTLLLSCSMQFHFFPMDIQRCDIEIGSFGYTSDEFIYLWEFGNQHTKNVVIDKATVLNEFEQPEVKTDDCSRTRIGISKRFSCIKAGLTLRRKFGFYLLYLYTPTTLIVIISWLSFFINYAVISGRLTICLFSLLSLMTQSSSAVENFPHISYVKALDVWLFTCLSFVVTALFEFIAINFLCNDVTTKRFTELYDQMENQPAAPPVATSDSLPVRARARFDLVNRATRMRVISFLKALNPNSGHSCDRAFRYMYPVLFLAFNFVYWIYFKFAYGRSIKLV